jgi:hypothetical protein
MRKRIIRIELTDLFTENRSGIFANNLKLLSINKAEITVERTRNNWAVV